MKIQHAIASLLSLSATSHAALVSIHYEFDGADTSPTTTVGDISGSGLSTGAFTGGAGDVAAFSSSSNTIFVRTDDTGATAADGDTIEEAITNGAYASFTITAGAENVTLSSIQWSSYGTNVLSGDDFRIYAFQQSAGFSAGDEIGFTSVTEVAITTAEVDSGSLALTGTVLAGTTEEFRFYYVDNTSISSDINRLASFTVTGNTTAVPEPSSAALLGLSGVALILRRRK